MQDRQTKRFKMIYSLATQNKREELQEYLAQTNKTIDCMSGLLTVAGLLAMEGNRQAAELLRELGADVNEIAYGAARGLQKDYLLYLIKTHDADNEYIVRGAAAGLHFNLIDALQDEFCDEDGPRHFYVDIKSIAEGLDDSGLFNDAETALHTFATKPYFYFYEDFRHSYSFDIKALQKQGQNIKSLMQKYDLNFNQALAWQKDEIKILLFQAKNISVLMNDIVMNIIPYLSPLTLQEASDLQEKAVFKCNQQFLSQDLKAYNRLVPHLFFKKSADTSVKLLTSVETAKNARELKNALASDKDILKFNDDGHVKRARDQQAVAVENPVFDSIVDKYTKRLSF